jgi:hypothetical protein
MEKIEYVVLTLSSGKQILGIKMEEGIGTDHFAIQDPLELIESPEYMAVNCCSSLSNDRVVLFNKLNVITIQQLNPTSVDFYLKSRDYIQNKVEENVRDRIKTYTSALDRVINPNFVPLGTTIH